MSSWRASLVVGQINEAEAGAMLKVGENGSCGEI